MLVFSFLFISVVGARKAGGLGKIEGEREDPRGEEEETDYFSYANTCTRETLAQKRASRLRVAYHCLGRLPSYMLATTPRRVTPLRVFNTTTSSQFCYAAPHNLSYNITYVVVLVMSP